MIKLFQLEKCPSCQKVRGFLSKNNLSAEIVNVPRLGSERGRVDGFPRLDTAEVPILVEGDKTLQGSDAIIEHLENYVTSGFGEPVYGLTRTLEGLSFADAIGATKEALAAEGFGVLTEIDVKATMKKKLDVDFQNYVILGACNPKLAHQALSFEAALGLLLPCNVVVTEENNKVVVSAIDPKKMFEVVGSDEIQPVAKAVRLKLATVMKNI